MFRIIAAIGAVQILIVGVGFIRSKALAILLGPAGIGAAGVIDQLAQLVTQISAFSIPYAAVKFLSRSHSKGPKEFQRSYASLFKLLLALTGTGATIALAVAWLRPEWLGKELLAYQTLVILGILCAPLNSLQGFLRHTLAAARRVRDSALFDLGAAIAVTALVCAGVVIAGLRGFYLGNLLAGLIITAGTMIYVGKRLSLPLFGGGSSVRHELRENPDIVTFTLILYASSFALPLSNFVARYGVMKSFGLTEAGWLHAALTLSGALNLALNPANGLYLTPILNRQIPTAEKLQMVIEFQTRLMVMIGAMAMPLMLFPNLLLSLFFSQAFTPVSKSLFIFVLAQCVNQVAGVYQALLIGLDDIKVYGLIVGTGYVALGVLSWRLAPLHGLPGVACSLLISNAIILILGLARLSLKHGLTLTLRLGTLVIYVVVVLFLAGIYISGHDSPQLPQLMTIAVRLAMGGMFVASLALFLSREEIGRMVRPVGEIILRKRRID